MVASDRWESTDGWCEVLTLNAADLPAVSQLAHERIEALEAACSPRRPDSEINALVSATSQQISPLLADALAANLRAAQFTSGLIPGLAGIGSKPESNEAELIVLDYNLARLTVPSGVVVDPGPIVRAWAADWIATACLAELDIGCLINLDGNIAVQGAVPAGGWQIEVDDGQPSANGTALIAMSWSGGLASTDAAAPHWPFTAATPSRHWRTATVAAHSCERAKAASLAALTLGDAAPRWLTQRELPARLVHTGGIAVQTPGWPGPSR